MNTAWAHMSWRYSLVIIVVFAGMTSGCSSFSNNADTRARLEEEASAARPPGDLTQGKKVRWDGGGVIIGETDALAYSTETYTNAIAELVTLNRNASIQDMVTTYPDIALQTLQETEPNAGNQHALQMIASVFDSVWCDSKVWQQYVTELAALPKRSSEELTVHARFWRYIKNHQPEQALKLRLTRTLTREHGPMIRAEFHRLESIASMMSGDHEKSIASLERAISLVETPCPFLASKMQLLLGEFYRHAGRWDDWKSTWESAVIKNSRLVAIHGTLDPQFWNRAAFLRPAGMAWPADSISDLNSSLGSRDVVGTENSMQLSSDESVVWFAIAWQHLNRVEGQNAVLSFKKSEAVESNQLTTSVLQLYQARALVMAGQPGAASAILFRLISEKEGTSLADRAKAILAAMKLQNGSVAQGLNLIQSAIGSIESWPRDEQMRARADYALALLVKGHESEGLRQLERARNAFEEAGEPGQVRQCLWNRARYFEKTEQADEFAAASAELTEMERRLY